VIQKSDIAIDALAGNALSMAAQKIRRQQQRGQTLEWISTNALSALRLAWRETYLGNSTINYSLSSATAPEYSKH